MPNAIDVVPGRDIFHYIKAGTLSGFQIIPERNLLAHKG